MDASLPASSSSGLLSLIEDKLGIKSNLLSLENTATPFLKNTTPARKYKNACLGGGAGSEPPQTTRRWVSHESAVSKNGAHGGVWASVLEAPGK